MINPSREMAFNIVEAILRKNCMENLDSLQ